MSNVKNYSEQGGDKWVVGGTLEVTAEGQLLLEGTPLERAATQADSTATTIADLKTDFNALLAKLQAAGLMESGDGG
ncbi:MAG: Head fiber protein [Negativicutes bacterium]